MNVICPSIPMRFEPGEYQPLETECLFGEELEIKDERKDWYFCKLKTDDYCGWVRKAGVNFFLPPTHRVISIRSSVFSEKNIKSNYLHYLPLGSLLHVVKFDDEWVEILLSRKQNYQVAYVPRKDIIGINETIKDWVTLGEKLENTPYKWGGRDSISIDCSALIQLSYQAYGQNIPRNTIDQVKLKKDVIKDLRNLERGCVVFWEGHVGVMVDKFNCLHANAYHMKTVIEPLKTIMLRMNEKFKIIKVLNFNS